MLYYGTKLSDHLSLREPEGFLICRHVPVARTGVQEYLASELAASGLDCLRGVDGDTPVSVYRSPEEVFSPATIASFEGMPVTCGHPTDSVTAETIGSLGCGHAQNVRRGQGEESDLLIADLMITNPYLIDQIMRQGRREVSCGYLYDLTEEDGKLYQRAIRGNHIAIVDQGRAGRRVAIQDQKPIKPDERRTVPMKSKKTALLHRMFPYFAKDEETTKEDITAALDMISEGGETSADPTPPPVETPATDEPPAANPLETKLNALIDLLTRSLAAQAADAEEKSEQPPAADPLETLEKELSPESEADADPTEPDVIDPAELAEDTDMPEGEDKPLAADEAIRDAIRAIKPIIAALPDGQRRKAADAAAAKLRSLSGKDARPAENQYADLRRAARSKQRAKDGAPDDDRALGAKIMAARNANYNK